MNKLSFKYERTETNPNMPDPAMDHWRVTLSKTVMVGDSLNMEPMRKSMSITFSKGSGRHGAPPTLEEVLEVLASDACGVQLDTDNGIAAIDFNEWCAEYGYDTNSRKAERIYRAIVEQSSNFWRLLGPEDFAEIVYNEVPA